MPVYQIDMNVCATATIVADTPERALELVVQKLSMRSLEVMSQGEGGIVNDDAFALLAEQDEHASISSALTMHGPLACSELREVDAVAG